MLRFLDGFFLDLGLWVARFVVVMATLVVDFLGPLPPTAMGLCLDWHIGVCLLQLVPRTCYTCICVCVLTVESGILFYFLNLGGW